MNNVHDYIYLDVETTGFGKADEVVEIALLNDTEVLLSTLVKPVNKTEWIHAQKVHGISPEDVSDAPTMAELQARIDEIVEGKIIVAYNAAFDSRFVDLSKAAGVDCAMIAYTNYHNRELGGSKAKYSLAEATENTDFKWDSEAHRATVDTAACRHVWKTATGLTV